MVSRLLPGGALPSADSLVTAITKNTDLVPCTERLRVPLETALANIRTLLGKRKTLIADKQKVTQDLRAAVEEGRSLAINVRAIAKGEVGSRSEKLVEFGVAPLRPRHPEAPAATGARRARSDPGGGHQAVAGRASCLSEVKRRPGAPLVSPAVDRVQTGSVKYVGASGSGGRGFIDKRSTRARGVGSLGPALPFRHTCSRKVRTLKGSDSSDV